MVVIRLAATRASTFADTMDSNTVVVEQTAECTAFLPEPVIAAAKWRLEPEP